MILTIAASACSDDARPQSAPTEIVEDQELNAEFDAILEVQADAVRRGDWRELYGMYTSEQQARCSLDDYVQRSEEYFAPLRAKDRGAITAEVLDVSVSGDTALVEYLMVQDGAVFTHAQGDEAVAFVRADGEWHIAEPLC